jgi:hypothetical protein
MQRTQDVLHGVDLRVARLDGRRPHEVGHLIHTGPNLRRPV